MSEINALFQMLMMIEQIVDQIPDTDADTNSPSAATTDDVPKYSTGVIQFGLECVGDVAKRHIKELRVAEVGSGNGEFAKFLSTVIGHRVITIDPLNYNFLGKPATAPDFPSAYDYRASCQSEQPLALVLNWPTPNSRDIDPFTDKPYDISAIEILKPALIFLIYASCGASGSTQLSEWLETQDTYIVAERIRKPYVTGSWFTTVKFEILVLSKKQS